MFLFRMFKLLVRVEMIMYAYACFINIASLLSLSIFVTTTYDISIAALAPRMMSLPV